MLNRISPLQAPKLSKNERMILDIVRRLGPIARAAITPETNLTQQSVHRIIEDLLEAELLRLGAPQRGKRGHPSPKVELNGPAGYSFGLSIHAESVVLCLMDLSCRTIDEETWRVEPLSRPTTEQAVRTLMQQMLARNDVPREKLIGMGVGVAGFFVRDKTQLNAPDPMRDWSLTDILPELEAAFELPIRLENNANTAAVGELFRGIGQTHRNFGYLSFHYGFGGGVILDGRPVFGANGNAGELNNMFTPEERDNRPALHFLVQNLQKAGVNVETVADLRDRFDPTWPGVEEWLARVMPQVNRLINTLSAVNDPEAIIFGGQIPEELARMIIERAEYWERPRYGSTMARPELLISQAKGDAGANGAAIMLLYEAFFE